MRTILLLLVLLLSGLPAGEAADRLLPLALPREWTLFLPASEDGLALESLTAIPAELNGASGRKVAFTDHACVLDRAATSAGPAVFMYEFDADEAGLMQAGGGADWFWKVLVNGSPAIDRLQQGNQAAPITHRNHDFYLPVRQGRNLVVALVRRGSNGWKFAFGPVPFTALGNGVLVQPGLAATDCVVTRADGTRAAQAEALRDATITGRGKDFSLAGTLGGARLALRAQEVRTKAGNYAIRLAYTLTGDRPLDLAGAEAVLRFAPGFTAAATVRVGDQESPAAQVQPQQGLKGITVMDGAQRLVCTADEPVLTLRPGGALEIAAAFPDPRGRTSVAVAFQIEAGAPPFRIAAGADWAPLRLERTIAPGSILDFSFLAERHAPAGRLGRVLPGPDGRLIYEKTGERARLVGANLCFDANYIPAEECDALAEVFRRQGYNAVRFHHTDVHLVKGVWNAQTSYDIDPQNLDRLDRLFAAMKRAGMYVTIDFYTMRYFGPGEIAGIDRRISGDIKQLLPVSESAFQAWAKLVLAWMGHVNPYTGIAWKDDPALTFACPLNEDAIYSVLGDEGPAMALFRERYQAWKREQGITGEDAVPLKKDPRFARFAIETKRASNRRIAAFLKEHGIGVPLSGSNWWNTQAQAFTRAGFDVVDNHQYADHPYNGNYNQSSALRGDPGRSIPTFMMPTRISGRPFAVTEYNFCFPNQYRAEGGALFGACSALQDWDAVYRFAWSHGRDKNLAVQPVSHFDIASDLLVQHTDRQIALLFGRGDVSPAGRSYLYAVTAGEAFADGFGGMWSGGLFPAGFSVLGLVSRIGSQPLADGEGVRGSFAGVCAGAALPEARLGGNRQLAPADLARLTAPDAAGEIVSDTGEIHLDPARGRLRVVTPRTECLVASPGGALVGRCLAVDGLDTFASISASAMDGETLERSSRILVLHLTNLLNTGMRFSNHEMRRIEEAGALPHLVRCGRAGIALKCGVPGLKVHAVGSDGRRLREVPATYVDGTYRFTAAIVPGAEAVMAYELAR